MFRSRRIVGLIAAVALLLLLPSPAHAYIGPGAGFALAGSVFAVFAAVFSAVIMLLTWPLRWLFRIFFGSQALAKAAVQRVVAMGFDGMDWHVVERLLSEGKLPNLARLRDRGACEPLTSSVPPVSEVAWSSFQTGMNPGKHGVFDCRRPAAATYTSESPTLQVNGKASSHGAWRWLPLPLKAATIESRRRGISFWELLSRKGIFSAVLRVPHSRVPDRLHGVLLGGSLDSTTWNGAAQGSLFVTQLPVSPPPHVKVQPVTLESNRIRATLTVHQHPQCHAETELSLPFEVSIDSDEQVILHLAGSRIRLRKDQFSDWIPIAFHPGLGKRINGICRFLLLQSRPELRLYVTPVHLDPEFPAVPISAPSKFGLYLAKRFGPFGSFNSTADVQSADSSVLSNKHLLRLVMDDEATRLAMFLDLLGKVKRGLCLCVFEGIDTLHHALGREHNGSGNSILDEAYRRADEMIGRVVERCADGDLILIFSSHGQAASHTDVDLNRWLEEAGYLAFQDGRRGAADLAGVDWASTRAFAGGSGGIYLNKKSRFAKGHVVGPDVKALKAELSAKLAALSCPVTGAAVVQRVYDSRRVFRGPRIESAPDLLVAFADGFRATDETALGITRNHVFAPTAAVHSHDAAVDRSLVKGVLFANRPLVPHQDERSDRRLADIAPTLLKQFGVAVPDEMDGIAWEFGLQGARK